MHDYRSIGCALQNIETILLLIIGVERIQKSIASTQLTSLTSYVPLDGRNAVLASYLQCSDMMEQDTYIQEVHVRIAAVLSLEVLQMDGWIFILIATDKVGFY